MIFSILSLRDSYGYQIIQDAREISGGSVDLKPGQLYPILRKMEKEKLIESYWVQPEGERERRYYSLTAQGKKALDVEKREWGRMHTAFSKLWAPGAQLAIE